MRFSFQKNMKHFFLLLFLSNFTFAQFNEWKNFSSLNSISNFSIYENTIWAGTNGGVFSFNTIDSTYQIFRKTEGLKSQVINAIHVTESGNVWIGSNEGYLSVLSQSGEILKNIYDIYNSDNEQKAIRSITSSGDTVFVAHDFGLSILSDATQEFITTVNKFGDFNTKSKITYASKINNRIAITTIEGIAIQKENSISLSDPTSWDSYPIQEVSYKVVFFDDKYFIATESGVYTLEDSTSYFQLSGNLITDINVFNSNLYLSFGKNIYQFDGTNFIPYLVNTEKVLNFEIHGDTSHIATSVGLFQQINSNFSILHPNGPTTNLFNNITVDEIGNVWVASGDDAYGKGIFKYDGEKWTNYNKTNENFYSNSYHSLHSGNSGTLYFNNWGYGFTTLQNDVFKNFTAQNTGMTGITDHPTFLVVSNTFEDKDNNVWALNYWSDVKKPLSVMKSDSSWIHFDVPIISISNDDRFDQLFIDQYGTKWFGVFLGKQGLFYFNDNNTIDNTNDDVWGYLTTSDGLAGNIIQSIVTDKYGQLWIGTNSGVNIISNPAYPTDIKEVYALKNFNVSSIYVDPLNRKWISTNEGVYYISTDGYVVYNQFNTKNSPLATNNINSIVYDETKGIVYFASDYGMSSLTTEAISPQSSFTELFAYPNPMVLSKNSSITIEGLIKDSQIKIFDISGNLVNSSEDGTIYSPGGKVAFWDGRNSNGKFVQSGIYLIVAYNAEGKETALTKIAVVK